MPRDVLSAAQPHTEKPQQPLQDIFSLQFFLFLSHPYFPLSLLIYSSSSSAFHPRDKKKKIIYMYSPNTPRDQKVPKKRHLFFSPLHTFLTHQLNIHLSWFAVNFNTAPAQINWKMGALFHVRISWPAHNLTILSNFAINFFLLSRSQGAFIIFSLNAEIIHWPSSE